jgi:hypothetical protein
MERTANMKRASWAARSGAHVGVGVRHLPVFGMCGLVATKFGGFLRAAQRRIVRAKNAKRKLIWKPHEAPQAKPPPFEPQE